MGALLERHGVGLGKYKVGGSYPDNILRVDETQGLGREILKVTSVEASLNFVSVEPGEDGNFYVGASNGTSTFFKYDNEGEIVWNSNYNANVSRIKYDQYSDLVWVWQNGTRITAYSLDGQNLFDIPFTTGPVTGIAVTQEFLIVGYFGGTTSSNNIVFFNKQGTEVRRLSSTRLRALNLKGNNLYVAETNTLTKYTLEGTQVWQTTVNTASVASTNVTAFIQFDSENNIHFMSQESGTVIVALYVLDDNTGAIKRNWLRNAQTINPSTITVQDLPYSFANAFVGNGDDYPVSYTNDNGGVAIRTYDNQGYVTFKRILTYTGLPANNATDIAKLDSNKNMYCLFSKRLLLLDMKKYYRIVR